MGCDIHGVFQRFDPNEEGWFDVESKYEQERHYQLFAVLAGVRNGSGFAGIPTGDAVVPISEPRGLPDDFVVDEDSHPISDIKYMTPWRQKYAELEEMEIWMGDHSHSWLSGEEMLEWFKNAPEVTKTGVLDREVYESWDHKSFPTSYSGDVCGGGVQVVNDSEEQMHYHPNWTHIRCTWKSNLGEELTYFFDEVTRLIQEHGKIRFVFGFDS